MDYNYSIIKSSTCTLDFTNKKDYINIYFVLSGNAKTLKKESSLTYHAGELFIRRPDMKPLKIEIKNGSIICLEIHTDYFERFYLKNALNMENNFEVHHHIKETFVHTIRCMYEKKYSHADISIIKLVNYLRIFFETFDNYLFRPTLSPLVNQVIEYVNEHYKKPLKLCVVARDIFANESFLSRKFGEEMQMTFSEYLTNIRVFNLSELLVTRGEEGEIWKEFGFVSNRTFLNRFKEIFNMSPREFILHSQVYRSNEDIISDSVYLEILKFVQPDEKIIPEIK